MLAIFIEIGSCLTDREQKISWHSFLNTVYSCVLLTDSVYSCVCGASQLQSSCSTRDSPARWYDRRRKMRWWRCCELTSVDWWGSEVPSCCACCTPSRSVGTVKPRRPTHLVDFVAGTVDFVFFRHYEAPLCTSVVVSVFGGRISGRSQIFRRRLLWVVTQRNSRWLDA